jgi:hypothetical protein
MAWTTPTIADFKAQFNRDFPYAPADDPDNLDLVIDSDITKAINQALLNFNDGLFPDVASATLAFLYLAAFYLVTNLQNSAQGIGAQAKFPINSKSVGGVSVSYSIPDKYLKDPVFSIYATNGYGIMYLSMVIPCLVGNVGLIAGYTTVE